MNYEEHEVENDGDYTKWIRPVRKGYKMACCDCNLVHDLDFRIRKEWRGLVVEFRARRNNKETKRLRKAQEKCNGFCGEYECKENQSICKRKAQKK